MQFKKVIESISTFPDLKRAASAYVIDYKNLSNEEIENAIIKTGPQYYFRENIENTLHNIMLDGDRDLRILTPIILKILLQETDEFMMTYKELTDQVIAYEQYIVNESNTVSFDQSKKEFNAHEFFSFVLEAAWEHNNDISVDEKNLLNKIRKRFNITENDRNILEASIGRFPTNDNRLHTRENIEMVKRKLQNLGLVFSIRDEDRQDYIIIPDEVALELRKHYSIEMKTFGYKELLNTKYFRGKKYLKEMLAKKGIETSSSINLDSLKENAMKYLTPSELLAGFSARDGFDTTMLSKWCSELNLPVSGQKNDLVYRIINYYDGLKLLIVNADDEREVFFEYYQDLAARELSNLRSQNIIVKDNECERYFEQATNYLFERFLVHKPLALKGTEHCDGVLSFQDKIVMWDNKSKESEVNLGDHIKQFDRYIKSSEKDVPIFLVIGPSFTQQSISVAMNYMLENDTVISMITADELKQLALLWSSGSDKGNQPFPLGYFKQPGRFNVDLVQFAK